MGRTAAGRRGGGLGYLPSASASVFTITSPPDGAWSWFGDPRALNHNGYTYIGYVDTTGNVCMRVLADGSQTAGSEIILKAALDYDDHPNPSFAVLPNGKLGAWYCRHEPASTTMHQRISVNTVASDPTLSGGFGSETDLDSAFGGTSYDYPVPVVLGSTIYMFSRDIPSGTIYNLRRASSTDNCATWSTMTTIASHATKTKRAYWKIVESGGDIHFAYTDGSPNTDTTSLYHFYWDESADTYHLSDGTTIGASLPLVPSDMTAVHTSANTWVWDIAIGGDGYPRILYPTWTTEFSAHVYNYARWSGSAWVKNTITTAGAGIDATGVYSGGFSMDHSDPNIVYASRQISTWEIYRYVTADGGSSWVETALTSGSSSKNIRPYVAGPLVVWLTGTYTGYSAAFNMGITGYA